MKVCWKSDVGRKRTINEDSVLVADLSTEGNCEIGLFIVADGVGGRNAGEIASSTACKIVADELKASLFDNVPLSMRKIREVPELLYESINVANRTVYDQSRKNSQYSGMSTTITVVTVVDQYMFIGHVGDCRVYKVNGSISQITKDHSIIQELIDAGKITKEDVAKHPYRYTITRALGLYPTVKPDIYKKVLYNDDHLVICSDGLTNMVNDDEIAQIVTSMDVEPACEKLVDIANERGGDDNISVILVKPERLPTVDETLNTSTVYRARKKNKRQNRFQFFRWW